ncbi:Endocytosis and vacuole integrity protein, variant 2 [Basidiobolus ranarum]|uniref:Endocytosis and vacuole integrity protein, variant 2 n=1 Tax=Basidiobolus ranarum TaxID=34480 RepID=A0ABR2WZU2_9FUNG
MSGLSGFLQTELIALSNEAKRKNPEIKEAVDKVLVILRAHQGDRLINELSHNEETLRPFFLACQTKNLKLTTIAISCLQRLILHNAIPESSAKSILKSLSEIASNGVLEVQLKILQIVLPLITNYHSVQGEALSDAILLCFRLQESKNGVVNNTAAATLRQLVIYVFDKVKKETPESPEASEATEQQKSKNVGSIAPPAEQSARDAFYLFQDLCLLISGESPIFLKLTSLSRPLGLELIESVLTNHYKLFRQRPEFSSLLKEKLCPLIIKHFSDKSDFSNTVRSIRVIYLLIKEFSENLVMECEIFLTMLVKMLGQENPLWQRILSMEVLRGICLDSSLVRSIYRHYDRKKSTHVFHDIVNAIGHLSIENPSVVGTGGGSNSLQAVDGAHTAGATGEAKLSVVTSIMKIQCIDQLDKAEPPAIPESYLYYLALVCLHSIADGLASFVLPTFARPIKTDLESNSTTTSASPVVPVTTIYHNSEDLENHPLGAEFAILSDITNAVWPGLLAVFSFFLTANMDHELFHATLQSYQNFTNVCGVLKLVTPRDAFLTSLCRGSIPNQSEKGVIDVSANGANVANIVPLSEKNLYSLHTLLTIANYLGSILDDSWYLVLATLQQADLILYSTNNRMNAGRKTGNLTTSSPASPSASALSFRRAMSFPASLTSSPTSATSPDSSTSPDPESLTLSAAIKRLFDNTKYLDNEAFLYFSKSICRLSSDITGLKRRVSTEIKNEESGSRIMLSRLTNKTESFAIRKIRQTSLLNMDRLVSQDNSGIWDMIMNHLIDTANYLSTAAQIRTQTCEAIADIIAAAMVSVSSAEMKGDEQAQIRLLVPLKRLVIGESVDESQRVKFIEVQKIAIETLNKLLQTSGESFTVGWPMIFDMIKSVCYFDQPKEEVVIDEKDTASISSKASNTHSIRTTGLVRVAFPCLQLICTDFLPLLDSRCLLECIKTLSSFVLQTEDLNISLTAVRLLWNVSDFLQTKRIDLERSEENEESSTPAKELSEDMTLYSFEDEINEDLTSQSLSALWALLLHNLSKICTDLRPEVRNGAIQTLFRTIGINGGLLKPMNWKLCIWKVIFPLIDSVKQTAFEAIAAWRALKEVQDDSKSFMMVHHSRGTIDKQWDESHVLVLGGVTRLFKDFLSALIELENFQNAWDVLLRHLKDYFLNYSPEVTLASIKSFHSLLSLPKDKDSLNIAKIHPLWVKAWEIWEQIGSEMVEASQPDQPDKDRPIRTFDQDTVTAFTSTFIDLYEVVREDFELNQIEKLMKVLYGVLTHQSNVNAPSDVSHLTPLQSSILEIIRSLKLDAEGSAVVVLHHLCGNVELAFMQQTSRKKPTYIALARTLMDTIKELLLKAINNQSTYQEGVFEHVIKTYSHPMKLKYECPTFDSNINPLWKTATLSVLEILEAGMKVFISVAEEIPKERFLGTWNNIVNLIEGTIYSDSTFPSSMSITDIRTDENFDIEYLDKLQTILFPFMGLPNVPREVITRVIRSLEKGSRLYADSRITEMALETQGRNEIPGLTTETVAVQREHYAIICLKCLFKLCSTSNWAFHDSLTEEQTNEVSKRIAQVTAPILISRCRFILDAYVVDSPLFGKMPLPRLVISYKRAVHLLTLTLTLLSL